MYQITGLGLQSTDLTIGTFCHESGHMLCRFPDLYDYGKQDGDFESSAGLGIYCLMSAGNHNDGGHTPAPICAYLRYLAGWCPTIISLNTPSLQQAIHGAYDTAFMYATSQPTEFFLVENRSKIGLDQCLPSNGLAVYHCDIKGSNERQSGTAEHHYQCSLLQADGRRDLEQNANQGGADDFFSLVQGEALSELTNPSTRMWDGSDSGLRIADIRAVDKTITFFVVPRRSTMNGNNSSTELDPTVLQHLQQQKDILQANLDLFKLTQQLDQEKLKAEVDKVKLEADRQKADADKIKAFIPSGATTALTGETKTDEKFGYLAQIAVFEALNKAAHEIAMRVRSAIPSNEPVALAMVDTLDFCGDDIQASHLSRQVVALINAMTEQTNEIDNLLEVTGPVKTTGEESLLAGASLLPLLGQVLASAPGAISWAADIASYFRSEATYKSVEAAVPLSVLQACVADALISAVQPKIQVGFPNFHTFGAQPNLPILSRIMDGIDAQAKLGPKAAQLKIQVEALKEYQEKNPLPQTKATIKLAETAYATSESLIQSFGDFVKLVNAVPEGKNYSPLVAVAIREYLKGSNGHRLTHLLYLNVVSSGGEVEIQRTLWWDREIIFLGGCVVTFVLADLAGIILAAGTLGKMSQTKYSKGQVQSVQFNDLTG